MNEEYIYPTKSSRIRVLAIWLVVFAAFAVASVAARAFLQYVAPLPPCDQLVSSRLVLLSAGLTALAPALIFARTAWLAYLHRQFPPPGASVFFRTKIQRGLLALLQGVSALTISVAFLWLFGYIATSETAQVIFGVHSCGT